MQTPEDATTDFDNVNDNDDSNVSLLNRTQSQLNGKLKNV